MPASAEQRADRQRKIERAAALIRQGLDMPTIRLRLGISPGSMTDIAREARNYLDKGSPSHA